MDNAFLSLLANFFVRMNYTTTNFGQQHPTDFKIYLQDPNGLISPLHDIPLYVNPSKTVCNMVVEAQRFMNAKMKMNLREPLNPIEQVTRKGIPQFVPNCFPYHGYLWNYGALPQTYEFPGQPPNITRCRGEDPIDVLEIGQRGAQIGEILNVKILGALALVDLDKLQHDWQLIAIDIRDPLANCLNDISDIEEYLPGLLKATVDWFKISKVPLGKPVNLFCPRGEMKSASFAYEIIEEVHRFWKFLMSKKIQNNNVALENTTLDGSMFKISRSEAKEMVHQRRHSDAISITKDFVDSFADKVYFVERCGCNNGYCHCKL